MTGHPLGYHVFFVLLPMLPLCIELLVNSYVYVTLTMKQLQFKVCAETNGCLNSNKKCWILVYTSNAFKGT